MYEGILSDIVMFLCGAVGGFALCNLIWLYGEDD